MLFIRDNVCSVIAIFNLLRNHLMYKLIKQSWTRIMVNVLEMLRCVCYWILNIFTLLKSVYYFSFTLFYTSLKNSIKFPHIFQSAWWFYSRVCQEFLTGVAHWGIDTNRNGQGIQYLNTQQLCMRLWCHPFVVFLFIFSIFHFLSLIKWQDGNTWIFFLNFLK